MKTVGIVVLSALALASAATAAAPKKWYWTEPLAESTASQKVAIPYCSFGNDNRCNNPPGPYWASGGPRMKVSTVDCTGADEYKSSFKFNRFMCKFVVADYNGRPLARGALALYVTGTTTFRWKLIS